MSQLLSKGLVGQEVRALQDVLNYHIRRGEPLKVDGIFGPKTDARVREFQRINGLKDDGLVGPKTSSKLYEVTEVTVPIIFIPRLQLNFPRFGQTPGFGLQPPQLIPPLHWPGPPLPPPGPFTFGGSFQLNQNSSALLPAFSSPANVLGLKITVPTRQDPVDPLVASRKAIIEMINDLPANSKFRAFLTSLVPNPVTKISPPPAGFNWGAAPLFDPLDPKGFGVKGNARFTFRISEGANGLPNVVFGAWGDGRFFLNFETKQGEARPRVEAQGQLFLGVQGVF